MPRLGHARILARLAAVLLPVVGVVAACTEDGSDAAAPADAGPEDANLDLATCPKGTPAESAPCALPEGTTCDFGQCGTRLAVCRAGVWRFGANPSPDPPCPVVAPSPETPCPLCWPLRSTCFYGSTDCTAADASANRAVASCPNGTWAIEILPCRDGGDSDVQGDAGPDAD